MGPSDHGDSAGDTYVCGGSLPHPGLVEVDGPDIVRIYDHVLAKLGAYAQQRELVYHAELGIYIKGFLSVLYNSSDFKKIYYIILYNYYFNTCWT